MPQAERSITFKFTITPAGTANPQEYLVTPKFTISTGASNLTKPLTTGEMNAIAGGLICTGQKILEDVGPECVLKEIRNAETVGLASLEELDNLARELQATLEEELEKN